jgi:UrcA family protein
MKIAILCAAAVGALGLSTAAYAQSPEAAAAAEAFAASEAPTAVAVRYGDLDLSRPADAHALYHRLQTAALQACGASEFSVAPYQDAVRHSACYRQGLDQAVQAVNLPAIAALHGAAATTLASN